MDKSNSSVSDSLMCKKVREALATCPAFRAINNPFSQHHPQSQTVAIVSNSPPSSSAKTTPIKTKPTKPHHPKLHPDEAQAEAIPITFDHTTPAPRVASPHARISENVEKSGKAMGETEKHGKKDMNNAFTEYIHRVGHKIRSVSNVGKGQGNPTPIAEANSGYGVKKKESHVEHFSNFILSARKKLRTTTGIRRE